MRSKLFFVASLLILASMVLTACQPAPAPAPAATPETIVKTVIVEGQAKEIIITATPAPTTPPAAPAAPTKKVVRFGRGVGDIPTIDPSLGQDTSSINVIEEAFIGVTRLEEVTNETQPGMATKWDVSDDGLTYTFHLRTDVPWVKYDAAKAQVVKVQDCKGADRMVTADDFMYGITRTLTPNTAGPYAFLLDNVIVGANDFNSGKAKDMSKVGIKVIDPATISFTFITKAAYNAAIAGLWMARAEPKWVIEGDDCNLTAAADRWTEAGFFQSYGPFTMKEWIHDSELTLIKNPFWPGSDAIPQAKLDEVVLAMVDDPAAFSDYEAGNMEVANVPLSDIDRAKSDPTLSKELKIAPELCTYYYGFNTKAPVVDDVRVRLALSEAIDRQSLIDNVTKGNQEPAQWFSRPGLAGAPTMDKYKDLGVKFDVADAKKQLQSYLDEKKTTVDKLDITLMYNTNAGHQKIAEAIQQMWKDNLGLNVKVTSQEWKVYLVTTKDPKNTPQIFRLGWCQDYPDANNWVKDTAGFGGNANPVAGGGFNWKDQAYEDLLNQSLVETDPAKRTDLIAKAEDILVKKDAVMAPIYWYTRVSVTKPYVTRTWASSDGQDRFEKWDVDLSAMPK